VCVYYNYAAVPIIKMFAWGEVDSGGHVLRETTSRGLCGLVCPSRTSERWGKGDCVKEGGGEEGDSVKELALGLLLLRPRSRNVPVTVVGGQTTPQKSRLVA
jgi:hypothetical protein